MTKTMASVEFKSWLQEYLLNLNKATDQVLIDYVISMFDDYSPYDFDETLKEGIEGILEEVVANNLDGVLEEIISQFRNMGSAGLSDEKNDEDVVSLDQRMQELLVENRNKVLSKKSPTKASTKSETVCYVSSSEEEEDRGDVDGTKCVAGASNHAKKTFVVEAVEDDSDEPDHGFHELKGLTGGSNRGAVVEREKEQRARQKEASAKKKEQDKLEREKQKDKQKARKESEKKRTQKSEKRR